MIKLYSRVYMKTVLLNTMIKLFSRVQVLLGQQYRWTHAGLIMSPGSLFYGDTRRCLPSDSPLYPRDRRTDIFGLRFQFVVSS